MLYMLLGTCSEVLHEVGGVKLKEYECVQVAHHKDIGKTIEEWQKKGWRIHTYTCAQFRPGLEINHYLLFEKGE